MNVRPFTVFLIAGEESGDALGAGLMQALRDRLGGDIRFLGVGGSRMKALGLVSLFPMEEISLHGFTAVLAKIPRILALIRQTAAAVRAARPDALVIVDSPDFNLRVARRVRAQDPSIAIVDYVSPTVWVWRPGRSPRMATFVDRILAVLPFEPDVHRRLGGPPCTYVGHPLIEKLDQLRPAPGERPPLGARPTLLVLPGSRRSETSRLIGVFGETAALVARRHRSVELVIPAVPWLADDIRRGAAAWPVQPTIVVGEAEKFAAFRRAHAALAASGTVTLELALAGVPMVIAYRSDIVAKALRRFIEAQWSLPLRAFGLSNLILGAKASPEFLNRDTTPQALSAALVPLLADTPERRAQEAAFARLGQLMALDTGTPSSHAAGVVIETARARAASLGPQRRLEIGT